MVPGLILNLERDILRPIHCKLLPLLKINRNISNELVSSAFNMGGFDLHLLEVEQGVEALRIIISTYNSTLLISLLFKQSLEFSQIELEIDILIF